MSGDLVETAAVLEALLPRAIRALYGQDRKDPFSQLVVAQLRVIRLLSVRSMRPSEIGKELGMSASAVTQVTNRLEAAGLVERVMDGKDRRVRHLNLTARGKRIVKARRERRTQASLPLLKRLNEKDRAHLIRILKAIAEGAGSG
jgi:DNA-binding MarR family transcriptional regulator